ncbi:hypothetical protein acdb102_33620 [Acidothermaceae bacterium B102]|nr:hypothetical protein acdb102_33620 [Acidothermaceae bacterium B102]
MGWLAQEARRLVVPLNMLAAAFAAGVLFATTACAGRESASVGSAASQAPAAATTVGAVADPLTVTPPADYLAGATPPATLVDRHAGEVSMPWSLVAISGATLTVWFTAGDGDCYQPVGAHLDYVGDAVQVVLLSKDVRPAPKGAAMGWRKVAARSRWTSLWAVGGCSTPPYHRAGRRPPKRLERGQVLMARPTDARSPNGPLPDSAGQSRSQSPMAGRLKWGVSCRLRGTGRGAAR